MIPVLTDTVAVSRCRSSPSRWGFCFSMVFTAQSEVQGWQKLCRSIKTGTYIPVGVSAGKRKLSCQQSSHLCIPLKRGYLVLGEHSVLSCDQVCIALEEFLCPLMCHSTCELGTCKAQLVGLLPFKAASSFVFLFSQRQYYQKYFCEILPTPVTELLGCS